MDKEKTLSESKETQTANDKGVVSSSLLSVDELNTLRQWFNALQNISPRFLKEKDYMLGRKITNEHGARLLKDR